VEHGRASRKGGRPAQGRRRSRGPGSAGIDTALPATSSQVTAEGRGRFDDLAITVNQTKNLSNQAISVTWTGATPTITGPSRFAGHYLQLMQCWGDDASGPTREQCQFGGFENQLGGWASTRQVYYGGALCTTIGRFPPQRKEMMTTSNYCDIV
jgi:hypothetical protein